jgi:hypothetical protein
MHMAVRIAHDRAHVLARILDNHVVASRMIREEGGEVVDLAIVGDVEGLAGGVCGANEGGQSDENPRATTEDVPQGNDDGVEVGAR